MSNFVSLEYLNDYSIEELRDAIENGLQRLALNAKFKPNMKVLIKICMPDALPYDSDLYACLCNGVQRGE